MGIFEISGWTVNTELGVVRTSFTTLNRGKCWILEIIRALCVGISLTIFEKELIKRTTTPATEKARFIH